jgi:hypothetical protein
VTLQWGSRDVLHRRNRASQAEPGTAGADTVLTFTGAVGGILLLYGLVSMFGTPGVFVWFVVLLALRRHAVRPA